MATAKSTYLVGEEGGVPESFSSKFWGGARIEPRSRSQDAIQQGLEARLADPVWTLARQWQMGEFQAEDNGSPIRGHIEYEIERLNSVFGAPESTESGTKRTGVRTPVPFGQEAGTAGNPPLETVVEREVIVLDWRTRVQIGQQFERFVRRALANKAEPRTIEQILSIYRQPPPSSFGIGPLENPETIDYATQRFLRLVQGRAIDGKAVLEAYLGYAIDGRNALQTDADVRVPPLPAELALSTEALAKLKQALDDLVAWYAQLYNQPDSDEPNYWRPRELEYRFQLTTAKEGAEKTSPKDTVLVAPDYRNGDLDWYSCDIGKLPKNEPEGERGRMTFNPTRITFAGKPNERWWAFEDGNVNLGELDPHTADVVKLMWAEFALVYADDWYSVPLEVPVGSLTRILSLKVENVFGETFEVMPAIERAGNERERWQVFTLSEPSETPSDVHSTLLFLPPTLGAREESPPIEEVRFVRDEGANMVFAIEKTVQNGLGASVDGFEVRMEDQERERKGNPPAQSAQSDMPAYRLASAVPHNWIPYVPKKVPSDPHSQFGAGEHSVRLRRAVMVRSEDSMSTEDNQPMTRVLKNDESRWLNEESVPRAGVKVQLTWQRVRWTDGKTYVWTGRKVVTGRGEGSSGLRFDFLDKARPF